MASNEASPKYVIDTCSLTALRRLYPLDMFPGVWEKLGLLAETGLLISSTEVWDELQAQEALQDESYKWAKDHKDIFYPLEDNVQRQAQEVLAAHPRLLDLKKNSSGDPFIIATAIVYSCAVVTEEKPSGGSNKLKIPDVCSAYGVKCFPLLEMLRLEGLKVVLLSD